MGYLMHDHLQCWSIFAAALIIRLTLNAFYFQDYTQSDGVDYHNIAVNIAQGHGYSKDTSEPHRPFFFREPAYPLFLAGVYALVDFAGFTPAYLLAAEYDLTAHPEIYWARIAQCVLGAFTCLILYLTLRLVLQPRVAFVIALLFTAYLPLAVYTTMLMRETLQTFAVVCTNYFFAKFLLARRMINLVLFALTWALSNMTLQVTVLIGILSLVFLLYRTRSLRSSFAYTALATALMFVAISPWLMRSYAFYPDVRIVQSLGMSITPQAAQYSGYLGKLHERGVLPADSVTTLWRKWYALSEWEKFDWSFSGRFDSLRAELPEVSFNLRNDIAHGLDYFRRGWIESLWFADVQGGGSRMNLRPHSKYLRAGEYVLFGLSLAGFIFGYLAIPGVFLYARRLWPILLTFTYFVPLSVFIANETRRMLPIHGYIFMFSYLACWEIYQRFTRRKIVAIIDGATMGEAGQNAEVASHSPTTSSAQK
ncbi:MAG: hypothetical protein DKINENOH_01086 [bacterium]|nr:hypothetical protein [bacterium]